MLISQREILAGASPKWFEPLAGQIAKKLVVDDETRNNFPCIFARNAYKRGNVLFAPIAFDNELDKHRLADLEESLIDFLLSDKDWDGSPNTTRPLLAVFEPTHAHRTQNDFEVLFTDALQYLIDHDPFPWPEGVPAHPDAEYWSMCYRRAHIFVNASHPANASRLSRNLCDALVLVINPRERFDIVAGDNPKGHAIREQIRHNLDTYDRIPRSPLLGHYQVGDLEWPQYMLPDNNFAQPLRCPLKFRQ